MSIDIEESPHRDFGSIEMFRDIHRIVVTNSVSCFVAMGAESKVRHEVFSDDSWQRIEWAARALLSALAETKRAKPRKKPKAKVITFPAKQTS